MSLPAIDALVTLHHYPPVVHPRHAREILKAPDAGALSAWVGGYAITLPEHRRFLEDLLASLAWKSCGQAIIVHGLYGAGKSHLLVLLHLLCALPEAWPVFQERNPEFNRYALAMRNHHRLVVHFSLDEYRPSMTLEKAIQQEVTRAMTEAAIALPEIWHTSTSRVEIWETAIDACRQAGFDGMIFLIDELSLFLAGKSPSQREADAAFLQFLADLTQHAPIWLLGALQRHLSDVGALRTHSWRQVEDRFRRYALPAQEIGNILRDKLISRNNPATIRDIVNGEITAQCDVLQLHFTAKDLYLHWPFHPLALSLLTEIATDYLSPHRSVVEVVQHIEETAWLSRPANQLITPLDLFSLVHDDLKRDEQLRQLWHAVEFLQGCQCAEADATLASQLLQLLALLHLARKSFTVNQVRACLFNGVATPSIATLSHLLHQLRTRGAFLHVHRDSDLAAEVFTLAVDDDAGAFALERMREVTLSLHSSDLLVFETALQACQDTNWPLAAALQGVSLHTLWRGSERTIAVEYAPQLSLEIFARQYERLHARQCDAVVLLCAPGTDIMQSLAQNTTSLATDAQQILLLWQPHARTASDLQLWHEYTAWQRAALQGTPATTPQERRVAQRCRERADELRPVVEKSLQSFYMEGTLYNTYGASVTPEVATSLVDALMPLLLTGLEDQYPLFTSLTPHGVPTRNALHHLLTQFVTPGTIEVMPNSLLEEYIERFIVPLGGVNFEGNIAHVSAPQQEICDMILSVIGQGPVRLASMQEYLRRPPLGLSLEQIRLCLALSVRSGFLRGLDAFLQPLEQETIIYHSDEPYIFIDLPHIVAEEYRPVLIAMAEVWNIPTTPLSLMCHQVERRLREWLVQFTPKLLSIRTALKEWSEMFQVLPWGWTRTEQTLSHIESLDPQAQTLEAILVKFTGDSATLISHLSTITHAMNWWEQHRDIFRLLTHSKLPREFEQPVKLLAEQLARGEESFSSLTIIGEQLEILQQEYSEYYQHWHKGIFGEAAIAALKEAFNHPQFLAIKLLARLPLPAPPAANWCLSALQRARNQYCPGSFEQLNIIGVCTHCKLPPTSYTPMPNAAEVLRQSTVALCEYAQLLSTHSWAVEIRRQIPRAPENLAQQAQAFFTWQPKTGVMALLDILDDSLINWLCRDHHVVASRQMQQLTHQLQGHNMTVREVREILQAWLDPEQNLQDEQLLSFE